MADAGKSLAERGDAESARQALERSLTLQPTNAAAHYDLGRLLQREGEAQRAANHLARVTSLVPESEYAVEARRMLETLPAPEEDESFVLASYEIKRFDGSELTHDLEVDALRAVEPRDPLSMRIETGLLDNTNVALSPTNRNFVANGAGSPQVVFNPSAEYRVVNTDDWRAGPLGTGYFTINNGEFSDLNLQSSPGGLFVERSAADRGGHARAAAPIRLHARPVRRLDVRAAPRGGRLADFGVGQPRHHGRVLFGRFDEPQE